MTELKRLRVNYLDKPIGVGSRPCFTWECSEKQVQYRLVVSKENKILFDSNFVVSDDYFVSPVMALSSTTEYSWTVTVITESGEQIKKSSRFETAFLSDDFDGDFITMTTNLTKDEVSAFLFRRFFEVERLSSARLYIVGLGCQRTKLNGMDIAPEERLLTPTTNYDKTVIYNTYDVTDLIKLGQNCIEVITGNGFFNDATDNAWNFNQCAWRDKPMLKAQLLITNQDGSYERIITDESWQVTDKTPITFNNIRSGIYVDARIQAKDSDYSNAVKATPPKGKLAPLEQQPIKVIRRFAPIAFWQVGDNYIFDAGVNTTGFCELKIQGDIGLEITLKYGESLYDDKSLDQSGTDCYVTSHPSQLHKYRIGSNQEELFSPDFTYCGFRYVQVEGLKIPPTVELVTICEVYQDIPDRASFSCSNELINTIDRLAKHSVKTNFHWIPTDCPHREKNGWTGDAQLSCEQFLFHCEPMASYKKWLNDIKDAQREDGRLPGIVPTGGWGYDWGNGPAWDAALFVLPYELYKFEGDTQVLEMMLPTMERYLKYLATRSDHDIVGFGLGDWCPPDSDESDGFDCPVKITDTALYFSFAQIMQELYEVFGNQSKVQEYQSLKQRIKDAFVREFVDLNHNRIQSDSQTAYTIVLHFGLIPQHKSQAFADRLHELLVQNEYKHNCGIIGFKYLFSVLSDYGYLDTAFALATQTTYPSIGFWIEHGATSLLERWQEVQSLNHHMFSSISDWFFKYLAGIQISKVGCKEISIKKALPLELDFVKTSFLSARGEITVQKERINGEVKCYVTAPQGIKWTIIE